MSITVNTRALALLGGAAFCMALLTGCHTDMWIQPKLKPLGESDFFANGMASRQPVEHTVARAEGWGQLWAVSSADVNLPHTDNPYFTGRVGGGLVETIPPEAMQRFHNSLKEMLERGRNRFNIFCSPCHSRWGDGNGMIAQRGFSLRRPPASYHTDRLRSMPIGHFYDVMTNGYGVMFSYASRVEPQDRWAVAAYIRALQYSQNAAMTDIPSDKLEKARRGELVPEKEPVEEEKQAEKQEESGSGHE